MAGTLEWPMMRARAADAPADFTPAEIPFAGKVISMLMSLVTLCVLSICITRRVQRIRQWSALPLAAWLIVIIYVDSFLFVFVTALFKDIGLNNNPEICEGAILLCLICYMTTKIFIYLFLVEKAYIVRGSNKSRFTDKLYLFNCCFMMLPYAIVVILNFVWRISYINNGGTCIIGMEKRAMLPLIIFDVAVNVYLTILFIVPLRKLYSYKNNSNTMLHTMAFRTFIGSCATLTSSVANLTVLMVLNGEPGWVCLMCCNADILFSVLILHWVTSGDKTGQTTNDSFSRDGFPSNPDGSRTRSRNTSKNKSKTGKNGSEIGTETIISRHYAAAAATEVGQDWPDAIKADINASCVPADRNSGEEIAMNRIMVTHERTMVVAEERNESGDDLSETTAGTSGVTWPEPPLPSLRDEPSPDTMAAEPTTTTVTFLTTGTCRIKTAMYTQPATRPVPLRRLRAALCTTWTAPLPIGAFLIAHPSGPILFDTGESPLCNTPGYVPAWNVPTRTWSRTAIAPADGIVAQLRARGVEPKDLQAVVLSHLHRDHAGGLEELARAAPDVPVWVGAEHWGAFGQSPWRAALEGCVPGHWPPGFAPRLLERGGEAVGPWGCGYPLTEDGRVVAVDTPGHVPGHVSLVVRGVDGEGVETTFFLTGDATYGMELLDREETDGGPKSNEASGSAIL
ncbi:hypothetical protein GTA08_BOTSDO13014 [Neofusicoccum parvum]|nr:hypothetical protein GTA08_BOTSDO13014 [Neofusicoccum parvum]